MILFMGSALGAAELEKIMKTTYTINVKSHKTLAIVATYTVTEFGQTSAQHTAIRMALADGHNWEQHGGLFARVAP